MSALIVVDVQNDFLDNGSFAVKGSRSIIPAINSQLAKKWDLVVASRDWHPQSHFSFAVNRNLPVFSPVTLTNGGKSIETQAWPVHCVQDTAGAEFDPDLDSAKFDVIIDKGTDPSQEFFSAFQDVFQEHHTSLDATLKKHHITKVYVTGIVTEYCLSNTAIDAKKLGYDTIVLENCIYPITKRGGDEKIQEMKDLGIKVE